ncbi:MAG: hypothetical protein HYS22_00080 [Deltaproteobacteria bacterium]|nr:hypothetical protein [Deltaproteobacteria bacterium]
MKKSIGFILVLSGVLLFLRCGSASDPLLPNASAETEGQDEAAPTDPLQTASFAVTNPKAIGANAGTTCDGCTLTPPTGFTLAECVFSVGLTDSSPSTTRRTSVDGNGKVTCQVTTVDSLGRNKVVGCAPSFMIVCAR